VTSISTYSDLAPINMPAIIRGRIINEQLADVDRGVSERALRTPSPNSIVNELVLTEAQQLYDLQTMPFKEIQEYVDLLGKALVFERNVYLQAAFKEISASSDLPSSIILRIYQEIHRLFNGADLQEIAETSLGKSIISGWTPIRLNDGRMASIKAFGARSVHIVAGNSPRISAVSILRNIIARSDAIIKIPSNDPLTALAIARTMIDIQPNHPITKHLAVCYWRGGDEQIEGQIYQPKNIDKIIAWGGYAAIRHVAKYIQPGLELISLDPKISASIVGAAAFSSKKTMEDAAERAAADVGSLNQFACANSRIVFVKTGTDEAGLSRARDFGNLVFESLQKAPPSLSTPAVHSCSAIDAELAGVRLMPDYFHVCGDDSRNGAIIVSLHSSPVSFYPILQNRVANIVPIDHFQQAFERMSSYTQTLGVFPDELKAELRDTAPLYGVQRLISLGYALTGNGALPQDGTEPLRRMVKWIVDETCLKESIQLPWKEPCKC